MVQPQPGQFWNAFSTPDPTLNDGKFDDDPVGTCFTNRNPPPIKPSGNPCVNVTQEFEVLIGGNTYPISTKTTRADCNNGSAIKISGNPEAFNKIFTQGNIAPR
jgi:hypothetical protein